MLLFYQTLGSASVSAQLIEGTWGISGILSEKNHLLLSFQSKAPDSNTHQAPILLKIEKR